MGKISMVMFDLSGTTVYDDTGVRDCLYQAAQEYNLNTTPEEILYNMGTNKIHLYQFLIARQMGKKIDIQDFEKIKDPETYEEARKVFDRYQQIMLEYYRSNARPFPGRPMRSAGAITRGSRLPRTRVFIDSSPMQSWMAWDG